VLDIARITRNQDVPLRRWTGDLATPIAVHAATNMTVLTVFSLR
jgi:hypothetical protein